MTWGYVCSEQSGVMPVCTCWVSGVNSVGTISRRTESDSHWFRVPALTYYHSVPVAIGQAGGCTAESGRRALQEHSLVPTQSQKNVGIQCGVVVELVDTPALEAGARMGVRVRVSPAPPH